MNAEDKRVPAIKAAVEQHPLRESLPRDATHFMLLCPGFVDHDLAFFNEY